MAEETTKARGIRRTAVGVVTSDKMNKTRRVEISRLVKHVRYSKYIKRRTVCHVHDETNDSLLGDTVEIVETRPYSKLKHWRVVRVVTRAPQLPTHDRTGEAEIEARRRAEERAATQKQEEGRADEGATTAES